MRHAGEPAQAILGAEEGEPQRVTAIAQAEEVGLQDVDGVAPVGTDLDGPGRGALPLQTFKYHTPRAGRGVERQRAEHLAKHVRRVWLAADDESRNSPGQSGQHPQPRGERRRAGLEAIETRRDHADFRTTLHELSTSSHGASAASRLFVLKMKG